MAPDERQPMEAPPFKVIVVGAGFAGLSSARTLLSHNVSVVVLEAASAVGGRARTGKLASGTEVELGATWFHGVRDNPVYDMAVWQGVVRDVRCDPEAQKHEIDWQLHFARPLDPALLGGDLQDVAIEAVSRYTEAAEECTSGAQLGDGSVGDVLRRTFDQVVAEKGLHGQALNTFADAWHFREKLQRTFDGFYSTDDVSLAFAKEYEALDGPNLPVPGGYQALAGILAAGLDIRTDHRVSAIHYGHSGVSVTCDNGAVFEADCVLVTVSLGVLQANHARLFHPPLPTWKTEALQGLRIGVADKVFVEFEIAPEKAKEAAVWLATHASGSPGRSQATTSTTRRGTSAHASPSSYHTSPATAGNTPGTVPSPAGGDGSAGGARGVALDTPHPTPSPMNPISEVLPPLPETDYAGTLCLSEEMSGGNADTSAQLQALRATAGSGNRAHVRSGVCGAAAAPVVLAHLSDGTQGTGNSAPSVPAPTAAQVARQQRRRRHKRTIHSYAFLWPVADPSLQGAAGHPALVLRDDDTALAALPQLPPLCVDKLAPLPALIGAPSGLVLPPWLQGLHSIRYCPGPEWIEPSLLAEGAGPAGKRHVSESERMSPAVNASDGGASHVSGVLWITGKEAMEMEAASDAEMQAAISSLFTLFPQMPLPPGAKLPPKVLRTTWGRDPLFAGSYSYINVTECSGDAVDALAEPLCNDEGIPIVLFAGEATHRQYIGTVHGAFLSGCREAERLITMMTGRAGSPGIVSPGGHPSSPFLLPSMVFSQLMMAGSPGGSSPRLFAPGPTNTASAARVTSLHA